MSQAPMFPREAFPRLSDEDLDELNAVSAQVVATLPEPGGAAPRGVVEAWAAAVTATVVHVVRERDRRGDAQARRKATALAGSGMDLWLRRDEEAGRPVLSTRDAIERLSAEVDRARPDA
jgi:hypothetical protein